MAEYLLELGVVKLVQVQPSGLIIEMPTGYTYDVSRLENALELIFPTLDVLS